MDLFDCPNCEVITKVVRIIEDLHSIPLELLLTGVEYSEAGVS